MQITNEPPDSLIRLSALYTSRVAGFQAEQKKFQIKSRGIAVARLALFILSILLLYLSVTLKSPILMILTFIPLSGFLYLVSWASVIKRKINHCQILISINQNEIKALQGDFSDFDPGSMFIDYQHEFSYDLDIFGEHSLFRLVNRVATPLGKERLAEHLISPGTDSNDIRMRQVAVRELVPKLSWRHDFLAAGRKSDWENAQNRNVISWLDAPDTFGTNAFYPTAIRVNAILTISITLLFILSSFQGSLLPFSLPPVAFLYFLIPIGLIISRTRRINREQQKLERLLDLFRKYAGLLRLIEKEEFKSPFLIGLKSNLNHDEQPSSQILKKLTGILWGLEVRGNLIVSFFLNSFFLWDILLMLRLEKWRKRYGMDFRKWINTIAEFESLNSMANLSFNRPDLTWPEIQDGTFRMEILNGGHPLINPERRVDNSLSFNESGSIYLITGANMAGKSTLLRMAGVNMILAMAGGPVCASRFSMVPISVHTSVRTNDSLGDDESYFYAELKKLSRIISRLENGERVFVIIDEMLKGTNSHDKHTGSAALIRRLIAMEASGLIATHDIELGKLENDYPSRLITRCFEVMTDAGHLSFDYLLRPGISRNLNATFLMKKMGIIGNIDMFAANVS